MSRRKIMVIFGTRPEAIKMAPVVRALKDDPSLEPMVCVTAQHRQLLDQVLSLFGIEPEFDLNLMRPNQELFDLTAEMLQALAPVLRSEMPDTVLVHGDTTTCFVASLAAFYLHIPVGHVEAGLRTHNLAAPFPEEANRALTARLASYHFAPTERARQNLLDENVADEQIWITGNTAIDALLHVRARLPEIGDAAWHDSISRDLHDTVADPRTRVILMTGHRRENFGQGFLNICRAVRQQAEAHRDWIFVYPVHLNPNVQTPVMNVLADIPNVFLISPLAYLPFVWLMDHADILLTDSGGIQEEAPSLGKPVLVMREVTERPEALDAGAVALVGTDMRRISDELERLLGNAAEYQRMAQVRNPYGDGHAAPRIARVLAGGDKAERTGIAVPS